MRAGGAPGSGSLARICSAPSAFAAAISLCALQTDTAAKATRAQSRCSTPTATTTITVTFKRNGRYDEDALKKLNYFLRDWRNDDVTRMDPQLFDILWEVTATSPPTSRSTSSPRTARRTPTRCCGAVARRRPVFAAHARQGDRFHHPGRRSTGCAPRRCGSSAAASASIRGLASSTWTSARAALAAHDAATSSPACSRTAARCICRRTARCPVMSSRRLTPSATAGAVPAPSRRSAA